MTDNAAVPEIPMFAAVAAISPIALEAVKRIDALFDIERGINGLSADERLRVLQDQSARLFAVLEALRAAVDNRCQVTGPPPRLRAFPRRSLLAILISKPTKAWDDLPQ